MRVRLIKRRTWRSRLNRDADECEAAPLVSKSFILTMTGDVPSSYAVIISFHQTTYIQRSQSGSSPLPRICTPRLHHRPFGLLP